MFVRFFVVYASSKQGIPDTAPYKTERYWEQFCRLHYGSNTHQMVDEKTHKGVLCFVGNMLGMALLALSCWISIECAKPADAAITACYVFLGDYSGMQK